MDHKQGKISKPINGKEYVFKFGMASSLILSRKVDIRNVSDNPIEFIAYLFWAGLMARAKENELPDKFSVEDAADLVDDMALEDAAEVYEIAVESFGFVGKLGEIEEEKKRRIANQQQQENPA